MKFSRFAVVVAAFAAVSSVAFAEDEAPRYPDLSVTVGGTLNDGNTEDKSCNIAIEYKNIIENIGEYNAGADGTLTRTTVENTYTGSDGASVTKKEDETTAKNGKVFGKILFTIADPFSAYLDASAFADEIADVDYRVTVGPGIAWDAYKSDSALIRFEIGVSPMWESINREDQYYTTGRAAENIEYTFAGGAKIWEKFEYLPAFDDSDKYLFNAEAGIESPLNDLLSLQFVVKDRYNSLPGEDNEKNDICATVGIRIQL